jgi:hypothetical protein
MLVHSLHEKKSLIGSPLIAIPLGLLFLKHSEAFQEIQQGFFVYQSNDNGSGQKTCYEPTDGITPFL